MTVTGNSFVLRNGRIIDPVNDRDEIADLIVIDGRVATMDTLGGELSAVPEFDLAGLIVCPGLIDLHVHLREPGQNEQEDIASGTRAAARGGFTTVLAMPNTSPPLDSLAGLRDLRRSCLDRALVRVLPCPALTIGQEGKKLTDFAALRAAGAVALSDDGKTIANSGLMREAMDRAMVCGLPIVDHCEDPELAGPGILHDGPVARKLGLAGKPRSSEDLIVARDIVLAAETGCRIHLQHLSSAFSVELVAWARQRGLPVSAEVTPHHLGLTEDAVLDRGANAKMNPPLREANDREALCRGLADGVIEAIATDHAPHTAAAKARGLEAAPNGVIGLETALAVSLTELYHRRGISLARIIDKFTAGPRRILNLPQGSLSPGDEADIAIFDLAHEHIIKAGEMQSKARNTPFDGWLCRGKVKAVAKAGNWIYQDSTVLVSSFSKAQA